MAAAPEAVAAPPAKKLNILIIALAAALVVSLGAGIGLFFALSHKSAEADSKAVAADAPGGKAKLPAQYLPLEPAFVINLEDDQAMRYLQLDIELMTHDPKVFEDVKLHMPRIRNALMLLYSQQHYRDIISREGKEQLQKQSLVEVQKVLEEETGKSGIEALYFTNFVMQ